MKNIFLFLNFFVATAASAQVVSGLYSGKLVNDSSKKVQNYELALSEYRDKITGYSYTTFVVNDTFYYSIKRIKATKNGGNLVVEDDKMIANNFPESAAKGVKQINTIPLTAADTMTTINGKWETTKTKVYYALHGAVDMKRDNDSTHSALIAHLTELKIISTPATQARNETVTKKEAAPAKKPEPVKEKPASKSAATAVAPTSIPYNQREQKITQTLAVTGDSIVLSFYDNGVVDGDIISAYINGQTVLTNLKLTEAAAKKTIYLGDIPGDSVTLILVAENLGSLPPNTGLVTVVDGENRYQVNFSANLQTNAAIVFRKRKMK